MHVPPFSSFFSRLLPLLGAALFLAPFLAPLSAHAAPDLNVTKTCVAGSAQAMLCTVTVTNIGDVPSVAPLSLTDTINGSAAVNLTGVGGSLPSSCSPGAQLINGIPLTCPAINTSLAAGASGTVLISYTMPQGGNFTNCVSVTQAQNAATPGDPNAANNTNICTTFDVTAPPPVTGSITIIKEAQPNDAQNFTFTSDQASIAPFPLDDDSDNTLSDQKVFTGLPAGSYTFTETQVSGWTLSSIVCTPAGGSTTNTTTGAATIALTAGAAVTCTFTNTRAATGTLTIIKDSQPNDAQDFHFATVGAGLSPFDLNDDGTNANPLSNSITFINVKTTPTTGSITIIKDAQPNDAQNFTFTSNQASIAPFPLDDDSDGTLSNQKVFTGLPAGSYTFTETQVSGWGLASIVCTPSGSGTTNTTTGAATISLVAGAAVICTFTNVQSAPLPGKICGVKFNDINGNGVQDAGDLGLANWEISLGIAAMPPVLTGSKGEYCFSDLPAGQYTLSETLQSPWQQTFPGAPGTHTLTVAAGQQLNGINFGNTMPGGLCSALSGSAYSLLVNGNFENAQLVTANSYNFFDQALVPGWDTTATDGLIEVWGHNYGGIPAYSGNQFIELNAKAGATVYQTFAAIPGHTVSITFAHRGRAGFANQMSLAIGPVGSLPVTLGTYTATTTGWTLNTVSYTFPLNGLTSYQIAFTSGDSSAGGNFLDAIDIIDQACEQGTPDVGTPLTDVLVFEFIEDTYPLVFKGRGAAGTTPKYRYRFYKDSGNYLAIDGAGMIFMLGPVTDNLVMEFGSVVSLRQAIVDWQAGPIPDARVFAYAEANLPAVFKGTGSAGQRQQYNYRYYAETGNYLAVDNAGMIYILGPYSGNAIKGVGSVESFRAAITRWQNGLLQ